MYITDIFAFYSPIIISFSIFMYALFNNTSARGAFYLAWLTAVTLIRIGIYSGLGATSNPAQGDARCAAGNLLPFNNATYSTYMIAFTAAYMIVPMVLSGSQNPYIYLFFAVYFVFDTIMRHTLDCFPRITAVLGDFVSGMGLGTVISAGLYSTDARKYLFVNTGGSDKDVCSMKSSTKFKCSVYKNGELVGPA